MLVFVLGGKAENPDKNLGARTSTNIKFYPYMTLGL